MARPHQTAMSLCMLGGTPLLQVPDRGRRKTNSFPKSCQETLPRASESRTASKGTKTAAHDWLFRAARGIQWPPRDRRSGGRGERPPAHGNVPDITRWVVDDKTNTVSNEGPRITRLGLWGPIRAMPKQSPRVKALEDGLAYSLGTRAAPFTPRGTNVSLLAPGVFKCAQPMIRS